MNDRNLIRCRETPIVSSPKIAAVLVFYDWNGPANWDGWATIGPEFCDRIGAVPNSVGYDQGKSSRTVLPRTLPKVLKKPDLSGFQLFQLRPPFKDMGKHAAYADFTVHELYREVIFSYDAEELDTELFSALTAKFSELSGTTYGIGYLRLISRGREFYSGGVILSVDGDPTSIISDEEEEEIGRWFNASIKFLHLDGFLRDVYPFNVLTAPHLRRTVFGESLAEWIASDRTRGVLREVANGVWTWVLTTEQLPPVRAAMETQGLLLAKLPDR